MSNQAIKLALLASMSMINVACAAATPVRQPYIVQLNDAPLVPSAQGQAPLRGDESRRQADELKARQRAVLALVPEAPVQYQYTTALNGFAILLTQQEAATLRANPAVRQVTPDKAEELQGGGARPKSVPAQ